MTEGKGLFSLTSTLRHFLIHHSAFIISLGSGARAACRLCQLTSTRHGVNGSRNLLVVVIENLYRSHRAVSSGRQIVTQLTLDMRTKLIKLFRRCLELGLGRRKPLQLGKESVSYREVIGLDIMTKLDRTLHFVVFKSLHTPTRQLKSKAKKNVGHLGFSRCNGAGLGQLIGSDAPTAINRTACVSAALRPRRSNRSRRFRIGNSTSSVVIVEATV